MNNKCLYPLATYPPKLLRRTIRHNFWQIDTAEEPKRPLISVFHTSPAAFSQRQPIFDNRVSAKKPATAFGQALQFSLTGSRSIGQVVQFARPNFGGELVLANKEKPPASQFLVLYSSSLLVLHPFLASESMRNGKTSTKTERTAGSG